jgi:hypothetical protein
VWPFHSCWKGSFNEIGSIRIRHEITSTPPAWISRGAYSGDRCLVAVEELGGAGSCFSKSARRARRLYR